LTSNTHIPLLYSFGFKPIRDKRHKGIDVVKQGLQISQQIIEDFEGDASRFVIDICPEVDLEQKIRDNVRLVEDQEEKKLERIILTLGSDEYLFEQGGEDVDIYVLLEGALEIIVDGSSIAEISEVGSFVGEMAIIRGEKRSATIKTREECKLYKIDGSNLMALTKEYPVVMSKMCKSLANKIAFTSTELSVLKLIGNADETRVFYKPKEDDTKFLESVGQYKNKVTKFAAKTSVFVEGELSFEIYILVKGEVKVSIGGETIAKISAPGMLFGEMSSLRYKPRSASIDTVSDCEFYVFQGLRLLQSCKEDPHLFIKIAQILANRLAATSSEYAHLVKRTNV